MVPNPNVVNHPTIGVRLVYFRLCFIVAKVIYFLQSLRMYNSLVERCFTDCVDTFRRKTLDKQEETCVRRCAEKFLKHSMRVGMRFAELNQGAPTQD
ncbi:mitochondrial import inner membrane translocase subunit Tim9-like [Primulina tabacum]|uniref:mitochondrial import inner membrane translocase subunit Tim9-like n=1 Tax=Primulina tabacum TaxID=48773 RepID=UPI003F5AD2DD